MPNMGGGGSMGVIQSSAPISPIAAGKKDASISFVKTPGETTFSAI